MGSRVNLRRFGTEAGRESNGLDSPMSSNLVVLTSFRAWDYDANPLRFLRESYQDHFLSSGNGWDLITRIHPTRKKTGD